MLSFSHIFVASFRDLSFTFMYLFSYLCISARTKQLSYESYSVISK